MSLFTRIANTFCAERLHRELDQEMRQHIAEAVARGRTEQEARRAFGNLLLTREHSYDAKILGWLEAVVSDAKFGARQLRKNWVVSTAAVLSLALAIGACTGAFRLIDAVLLRPLPVADPGHLYYLSYTLRDQMGVSREQDWFAHPPYRRMRDALAGDADLLAVGVVSRVGVNYGHGAESERAYRQYVSGNTFSAFGLRPALGRLIGPSDDEKPGAHPVAVLSYDYWTSRFGRDPNVIGRTFYHEVPYQIIGVAPKDFTGTEAGSIPDFFIPTMMNARAIDREDWGWFRIWIRPRPGRAIGPIRDRLQVIFSARLRADLANWPSDTPRLVIEQFLNTPLIVHSAATGVSDLKKQYGRALAVLGVLVGLVLLIACSNVANLLAAQAAARAREMALRVSIGAGRGRLVQLMMVESAMLALAATLLGGLFAWRSAPWVASMVNPPDTPLRLVLPADWRVLGFAATLAVAATVFFGMAPAFRAFAVKPASALRGGEMPTKGRLIYGLVAAQIAFCFIVHFAAGLFVTTLHRLSGQPTGFTADRLLLLEGVTNGNKEQPARVWQQIADGLRTTPGVEAAAVCGWPLMGNNFWSAGIRIPGKAPDVFESYLLSVSPGFLSTMGIGLLAGRDFTPGDSAGSACGAEGATGAAIVSESFARRYFAGENPVGRFFERTTDKDKRIRYRVVGLIRDVRYSSLREPMHPTAFLPLDKADWATFAVRTSTPDPLSPARALSREVTRMRSDFHIVSNLAQRELVDQWTLRERLLATLSLFFASLALLLASIGLYGVLNYSVQRRTREIGIRMALGAPARSVVGTVTGQISAVFAVGAVTGLAAGLATQRLLESLLYQVKATDLPMMATPFVLLLAAALLAAIPPVVVAVRIDPSRALRSE